MSSGTFGLDLPIFEYSYITKHAKPTYLMKKI
jgi:hypothetical protein